MNDFSFFYKTNIGKGLICLNNDILNFNGKYNLTLPETFHNLLIATNGGQILYEKSGFIVTDNYENKLLVIFNAIESFNEFERSYFKISINRNDYLFQNHDSVAIMGRCQMREFILIGIKSENLGKIYFSPSEDNVTDFIDEDDESMTYPIIEIAPNLDTFISMLRNPEELEAEL